MRTLKFIVKGQILKPDPNCDFSNLVPGTEGYLKAEFTFSPDWEGCVKVVEFSSGGIEFEPKVLKSGKVCFIPKEALARQIFNVKVLGKQKDYRITTNKISISQNGGKK